MTTQTELSPVEQLVEAVLVATGRLLASGGKQIADADQAIAVVREEVVEFIQGPRYESERDCILRGSVNPGYVQASIVASCATKIKTT